MLNFNEFSNRKSTSKVSRRQCVKSKNIKESRNRQYNKNLPKNKYKKCLILI